MQTVFEWQQITLFGERFDSDLARYCKVEPGSRLRAHWMIQRHYLHKWPAIVQLVLMLRYKDTDMGTCVFAAPPKEMEVRLGAITWELARLWIDDRMPHNTETWFIAQCVRYLRQRRPDIAWLVSYADPSAGHSGCIYRAANWRYDGLTDAERKSPRCDYVVNGKKYGRAGHITPGSVIVRIPRIAKHRYLLRLRKAAEAADAAR